MRARFATPLLAALLLLGASGSAAPPAISGPRVTQTVLGNGLRVVVVENHAVPLANVAMWYRFGSADDPPGHQGLAHALEHMMFRGTRALSGASIDLVHARLGIDANAETDYESTHYYQSVPVDVLAVALRIEADRMHGLALRPRDWELERGAVLAELSADESSATIALESAVRRAAYRGTPFAHDQLGTESDLVHTSVADLRRAYEAAYQPDNAALVVTGDVSPDAVVRLARTLFGPLRGHAHVVHVRAAPPVARGFTVRLRPFDTRIVDVALAVHGERAADSAAEEVTAELLGPEHAPLRDALTGADGPCSSYELDDDRTLDGGLYHLVCHLGFRATTSRDALDTIRQALRRLAAHPPSAAEVAYARRAAVANAAFARDSLSGEADYFGGNIALLGIDPRRWEADTARVSRAAVAAVLRRWAAPAGYGAALAGTTSISSGAEPERRERLEHVAPAADGGPAAEPAWTRVAPRRLHTGNATAVDAFALQNGLRVFVEPRHGNGTVYVRADLDKTDGARHYGASAHVTRVAEAHAIVIGDADGISMHGFARELPTMLQLIAEMWRKPPSRHALRARPQGAWIAVTGDVDPLAVRARTAEAFGGWHVDAQPEPSPSASPSAQPERAGNPRLPRSVVFRVGTSSVRALMMQPAPGSDDPDRSAMTLLDQVLGGNGDLDSRLAIEVRRRRGLVYMVATFYDPGRGRFFVMFEAPRARFRAARAAVRDVLGGLQRNPVTSEEVERARHKLLAGVLRDESNPTGILDRLSTAAREHRSPDDLQTLAAHYDAVTLDDVRRVARTRLTPNAMVEFDEGPVP